MIYVIEGELLGYCRHIGKLRAGNGLTKVDKTVDKSTTNEFKHTLGFAGEICLGWFLGMPASENYTGNIARSIDFTTYYGLTIDAKATRYAGGRLFVKPEKTANVFFLLPCIDDGGFNMENTRWTFQLVGWVWDCQARAPGNWIKSKNSWSYCMKQADLNHYNSWDNEPYIFTI